MPSDAEDLYSYVEKTFPNYEIHLVYEAGRGIDVSQSIFPSGLAIKPSRLVAINKTILFINCYFNRTVDFIIKRIIISFLLEFDAKLN
jgi:hypothetical protein